MCHIRATKICDYISPRPLHHCSVMRNDLPLHLDTRRIVVTQGRLPLRVYLTFGTSSNHLEGNRSFRLRVVPDLAQNHPTLFPCLNRQRAQTVTPPEHDLSHPFVIDD